MKNLQKSNSFEADIFIYRQKQYIKDEITIAFLKNISENKILK